MICLISSSTTIGTTSLFYVNYHAYVFCHHHHHHHDDDDDYYYLPILLVTKTIAIAAIVSIMITNYGSVLNTSPHLHTKYQNAEN